MKRLLLGLSLIAISLFISCEKEKEKEPEKNKITAKFQKTELTIDDAGGTVDFVLEVAGAGDDTYPYTTSISGEGFSITNTSGNLAAESNTFTVTAATNSNQTERTGILTVYMPNLDITLTATITQLGKLLLDISQYDRDKGEAGKANRANSYIIPLEDGTYKLSIERIDDYWSGTDALYGGNNSDNTIASNSDLIIKVLWADFDYLGKISVSADVSDKSMLIKAKNLPSLGGNMVVVVIKSDGATVLWNWHIWFSDIDTSVATTIMTGQKITDRNLGARSFDGPGTETYGLLYQWGRKDPFPGSETIVLEDGGDEPTIYTPDGSGECMTEGYGSTATWGTIALGVANPFTYYVSNYVTTKIYDWVMTGIDAEATNSKRWNNSADGLEKGTKTIFDPCPYGLRMPWRRDWTGFTESNFRWTTNPVAGRIFSINAKAFFPAVGNRSGYGDEFMSAILINVGWFGRYWNGSPFLDDYGQNIGFGEMGMNATDSNVRGFGFPIRPVLDI